MNAEPGAAESTVTRSLHIQEFGDSWAGMESLGQDRNPMEGVIPSAQQPMECQCIKQTAIPHATRLFTDFLYQFDRVRSFFSFAPFDQESFSRAARSLAYPQETRAAVAGVLEEQSQRFGATEQTRRNLQRFQQGAAAVVTGQQVGLFTGPMFAFYKALTAIRLAEGLTAAGLDCVPVFWLATEDHDLAEVNHTFLLDADYQPHRIAEEGAPHLPNAPVGEVALSPGFARQTEQVVRLLPESAWKAELVRALQQTYRPGETFGSAFGGLMARLMERFGVLLLDPMHPRLHRLAAGLFRRALESADELREALLERNRELVKAGYHAQVHVANHSTLLFQRAGGQRTALRRRNGEFLLGDQRQSSAALLDHLERCPDDFSPNVLLRPVLQDYLLPTVAYVSGAAEVAYLAQAGPLYQRLLGHMPVVHPRASFTLLDSRAAELLGRYQVIVGDVLAGPQALRETMAQQLLPAELAATLTQEQRRLQELLTNLRQQMEAFDHTLADATATSARKMSYQLAKIKRKAARAAGLRSSQMERDAVVLENLIYPGKNLQERVYSGIYFLAQFGPDLLDRLYQRISIHGADHQVLVL